MAALLDPLQGIISIHRYENVKVEWRFTIELVGSSWACMAQSPIRTIPSQRYSKSMIHFIMDRKIEIKTCRELCAEVRSKRDAVDITEAFDKGLNSEMGTLESAVAKEFKDPY